VSSRRLIEAAFPLRQVSLDSVHEKNVRHGHISTLHIWPARRPLAACRAALIATLLPDPGRDSARREVLLRLAGQVVEVEGGKPHTTGGILHWGRESSPALAEFREQIRAAYGGRAPRVLDPFAGGGAIPLEALRLGCEAVAGDLNPVAWFILKCTLDIPQRFAGKRRPLPGFALRQRGFARSFLSAQGRRGAALRDAMRSLGHGDGQAEQLASAALPADAAALREADLPWHLRAWGRWVLAEARRELAGRYPTYAELEPRRRRAGRRAAPKARTLRRPPRLLAPDAEGGVSAAALNAEFAAADLENDSTPRWVTKPPVAFLWARSVRCGNCRSEIPLLKTRWLCRGKKKRVLLNVKPRGNGGGIEFEVQRGVPEHRSASQRSAHDEQIGGGTMSRSGARCPGCGAIAEHKFLRSEGRVGQLGEMLTAVVVDGQEGKEYRLPTPEERAAAGVSEAELRAVYEAIPFGLPEEQVPKAGAGASRAFSIDGYGFDTWRKLFTNRQLLALGVFVRAIRRVPDEMKKEGYPDEWCEAVSEYLGCALNKLADYSSSFCSWHNSGEKLGHTFARFALPIVWDYCEVNPISGSTGSFEAMLEWVSRCAKHTLDAAQDAEPPQVHRASAAGPNFGADSFDLILTDPPYYDAIPYSDLMDFFHIWLRRALHGLSPELDEVFANPLGPKWDAEQGDGELIDDASRFSGDRAASKKNYEDGMARVFKRCFDALREDGRMVVVFANKNPDAWETLASALIRAGFVVDGSWPIATEMPSKVAGGARLSSSIWLVCKKRPPGLRPGWDDQVLKEMHNNIKQRLREFWDAGIRGPDFVWAATGPALEAFSRYPAVKKARAQGERLSVAEFLRAVRRDVVGFVVRRLLEREGGASAEGELDDLTTYYLLHRNDFGLSAAPAGACILYALSCNLSDSDLAGRLDLLVRGSREGGKAGEARLKPWNRRRARDLGQPGAGPPPLVDCAHKLMQLWKAGEQAAVDGYLEERGLWRHELFARVLQALVELAERGSEERSTLESILNHIAARNGPPSRRQRAMI